jgi:OHCU decarboxylase
MNNPKNIIENITKEDFINIFGGVYEHSPWVAESAFEQCTAYSLDEVHKIMKNIVNQSSYESKITLIKAHPDLGIKKAKLKELTQSSQTEQSSAGLDQLTDEEYDEFNSLNTAYKAKYDFPFIVAVKGLTKSNILDQFKNRSNILDQFKNRLENTEEEEFNTALEQIHKIAYLRLEELIR